MRSCRTAPRFWLAMEVAAAPEPPERITKLADDRDKRFSRALLARGESSRRSPSASLLRFIEARGGTRPETPLAKIFPQATHLTLFAATVGAEVSERIDELFHGDDFALGYALDAVASLGAEKPRTSWRRVSASGCIGRGY